MDILAPPGLRVLCVDDNADSADSMGMLLDMLGCEVETCYGGPAALALAERFHPDVCVLDINMPDMNGCELARRLRERLRNRPLLLIAATALSTEWARVQTAEAGFDLHLTKPVELSELVNALASFAERHGGRNIRDWPTNGWSDR